MTDLNPVAKLDADIVDESPYEREDRALTAAGPAAREPGVEFGRQRAEKPRAHGAVAQALALGREASGRPADDETPVERALEVLLHALGWAGDARHVIEALPHFDQLMQLDVLRAVLARLGYETQIVEQRLEQLTPDQMPCVVVGPSDALAAPQPGPDARRAAPDAPDAAAETVLVALRRLPDGRLDAYDAALGQRRAVDAGRAWVRVCRAHDDQIERQAPQAENGSWFWRSFRQFRPTINSILGLTLAANVLALGTPLFSMAVYNNILPSEYVVTLTGALTVALMGILCENAVRHHRSELTARLAARLNAAVIREGFARVLTLPLGMTERASVSSQISRLKQLENIQSVFTSHLASAVMDLPFTIVFLVAIGLIAGPLIYMPILLALTFVVMALILFPVARRHTQEAGQAGIAAQTITRETLSSLDAIQALKAEDAWLDRVGAALRRAAKAKHQAGSFEQLQHALAQLLTFTAGVLTLFIGGMAVMEQTLSIGGLIAVMMLIWRVLSPIQLAFLSINQIVTARDTIRQIDAMMRLPPERKPGDVPTVFRSFQGRIEMAGVAFRYPQSSEMILRGVNLTIEPGQMIGLAGATGVGKSTCMKLLLGLYKPAGGAIYIDGLHLAQLDPAEVRHAIGFVPPKPEFFYGSIAQNVRLGAATATQAEIEAALGAVGLTLDAERFPEGLDTRLSAERVGRLTDSTLQQLSIARALAKRAPILMLDDAAALLSTDAKASLLRVLAALKGRATVLMATNDKTQLALCDQIAVLAQGQIGAMGPPEQILGPPAS